MKKKSNLQCTIIGIILALVLTIIFNVSYWITLTVIKEKDYALNIGFLVITIILFGCVMDIMKNIHIQSRSVVTGSDLIPKGFNTVHPEDIEFEKDINKTVLNNEQLEENLGQEILNELEKGVQVQQNLREERMFQESLQ